VESTLLWVGEHAVLPNVRDAARHGWHLTSHRPNVPLGRQLGSATVAVVCPNGNLDDTRYLSDMLEELDRTSTVAIFLLPKDATTAWAALSRRRGQYLCLPQDAHANEVHAAISAAAALQPTIQHLQAELDAARNAPKSETHFEDLDEELRLAARLQRDFLPRRLPEVGPASFAVLYRPVGWVSGDIYDIARLDETHVGFYVVDAVGHGMPAALFTMFVKTALVTKQISGSHYEIIPPHVSLTDLNVEICGQNFSTFPFCTCVHCVLDIESLVLTYARAGHPAPILLRRDEPPQMLDAPGSLLGVFPDETYESAQVQLTEGDRLVLYTDGAEAALRGSGQDVEPLDWDVTRHAQLSQDDLMLHIAAKTASPPPGPNDADDVTVVTLEIQR